MIERWIRGMARMRWLVVLVWIALVASSVIFLPDLGKIVRETETKFVPSDAESMRAQALVQQIDPDNKAKSNAVIVLHRDGGLQAQDRTWLDNKIDDLEGAKSELGILTLHSAKEQPQLAEKFESKDKTTSLVLVDFPEPDTMASTQESVEMIRDRVKDVPDGASVHLTGSAPIMKDYQQTSQDGLRKTEYLTVGLVLAILLAVFRSPIAPLIPLLTIALSFVLSRGLVALGTELGLPVSAFTETFLVAVLFGAGTDYCILLIHRFREELSNGLDNVDALVKTMLTVGKTVIFSGSTVLIAFFLIGFAKFGLYQSAAGVAIGMLATLIAGMTLTPALMMIFGPKLFWPFRIKPGQGHGDSKLWGGMARLVAKRPLAVLLVTTLVFAPFTLLFNNTRSFDDVAEIDPEIGSVQGFRVVEKAFSSGEVLPVSVTLTSETSMRTAEGMAALEKASAAASQVQYVKEVRSAARPLGEPIQELGVPYQLGEANKALDEMKSGVAEISSGLNEAATQLQEGAGGIDQMASGLGTIADKQKEVAVGTAQLAQGTAQVAAGLEAGALQLQAGMPQLREMEQGAFAIASGAREAQAALTERVRPGLGDLQKGIAAVSQGTAQAQGAAASMSAELEALVQAYPQLADDPNFVTLSGKQQGLVQGLAEVNGGLPNLSGGLTQADAGIVEVAAGLGVLADKQGMIAGGIQQSNNQLAGMVGQFGAATSALQQMSGGAGQATQGLHQLADGMLQARDGVGQMKSELGQLTDGLGQGTDGLNQVAAGIGQVKAAQQGIVDNGPKQIAGWYLPADHLQKNEDLQQALDVYISPDGKIAKMDVVLTINPYSSEAMATMDVLREAIKQSLRGTTLQNPDVLLSGTTAQYHELDAISKGDFVRTGVLILVGIYVVLALLLRSVLAPVYILLSLGFSYLVTMGIVEWIFVDWLGYAGMSWTVSFFGFLLLVALGVDYSIFLMARFREEYVPGGIVPAMQKAMTSTGGVIISAAVIMGGTFAALMFSGVTALMQIGATVLIGLGIYTTVVMGLIVPAMAILLGEANWWPLGRKKEPTSSPEHNVPSSI